MLFGKHVNKYYLKYWFLFLIGVLALVAVDIAQVFIPRFLGQIIDEDQILVNDLSDLGRIVGYIMICAGVMFVGRAIWRLAIFRASDNIAASIRKEMFKKAESLSATYYHENKVGNIMNWFTSDIEEISEFFGWGTVMIVDAFFLSASVLVSMFRVNGFLTLLALVPIALIIVWGALVDRYMSKQWEFRQKEYDRLYDFAQENFTGIRVIKSFVKQNMEIIAFSRIARKNQEVNVRFARLQVFFDVVIEVILAVEMALVLGFGGWLAYSFIMGNPVVIFGYSIKLSVGEIFEFVGYIDLLIWPMIALGQIVSMRSRARGSLRRIGAFLDAKVDVVNPENAVFLQNAKGSITFKNFSFAYPGSDRFALKDVNLTIQAGEHVGIVGKIGSGKTTLVNSLFRLYNIMPGTVFIDDVDLMQADIPSLRECVAYAPQDNFLFSDKIENNIAFSTMTPDHDKVLSAVRFADVKDNIESFPRGYETVSGERGVTLSGGQKQRVSIARAYYKHSPILVMDDCVSAVDVKTEETILNNIKDRRAGLTTILIASRVSSVMHMDKIIVLDKGEVAAFGSHDELMKTSSLYRKMVYLQELEKESGGGDC